MTQKIPLCIVILFGCFVPTAFAETGAILKLDVQNVSDSQSDAPTSWLSWLSAKTAIFQPAIGTKFTVSTTGYASSPYQTDATPCITSVGTKVRDGVVAANFLPIGTILSINGKLYIVEDRMNSRYGRALDIWFSSTKEALEFGRQRLQIEVVAYGVAGQDLNVSQGSDASPGSAGAVANPGLLQRMSLRFVAFIHQVNSFLRAAVSSTVNQHDVNCFE